MPSCLISEGAEVEVKERSCGWESFVLRLLAVGVVSRLALHFRMIKR